MAGLGIRPLVPLQTTVTLTEAVAFEAVDSQENLSDNSHELCEPKAASVNEFNVQKANELFDDENGNQEWTKQEQEVD